MSDVHKYRPCLMTSILLGLRHDANVKSIS